MLLKLKILKVADVTSSYVDWFSGPETICYSDSQYRSHTFEGQKEYVNSCLSNDDVDLYGIFDEDLHVGNILISGLNSIHKKAKITYIVGDTRYRRKGVASFAVSTIVKISKTNYQLNKLYAGLAEGNEGSRKVLQKNGFVLEGRRFAHLFYNGKFHNQLDFGLVL